MILRNLFLVPKLFFLSIVINTVIFSPVLSGQCKSAESIRLQIEESLVAFVVEDEDENDEVIGTGFVLNIFGDIAAPKHVLIDNGQLNSTIKVQYSNSKSVDVEEFILLENSLNLEDRDWVVLKKNYTQKPQFTASEREYTFLNISHDRHFEDTPVEGFLWRVKSVKNKSFEVGRSSIVWIGAHSNLLGIFQLTVESYGGDSGSPFVNNCSGEVLGILWKTGDRGIGDFDHTGALMELALHQVVDFDTSQGIFRGESDRRDHRKSVAFWKALQAQLDFTDKELNLLNWTVRVEDWSLVGNNEDDFALKLRIEYKRIPRPSREKQHRPKGNVLYNSWVCFVWDREIAEETCIKSDDQRYVSTNGLEPAKGGIDIFEAGARVLVNIDQFNSKTDELKSQYQNTDFSADRVKGILVRFEPKFNTFNTLRHYDINTGYPQEVKVKPGVFSAVYEACIPSVRKHGRVSAKLIATSIETHYSGVLAEVEDGEVTSCISELE